MEPVLRFDPQGLVRLDETECWDFLRRHFLGRIALVLYGRPVIYPVNYAVDGESIVFRTAPGSKLVAAGLRAPVAFEVDDADELFETGVSVVVHGDLTEVTDRAEQERLRSLTIRTWAPGARDRLLRVEPQRTTGRRIPMHGDDDGLGADGG